MKIRTQAMRISQGKPLQAEKQSGRPLEWKRSACSKDSKEVVLAKAGKAKSIRTRLRAPGR